MSLDQRVTPPDWRAPWVAFALALAARLVVGFNLQGSPFLEFLIGDAASARELAQRIVSEGHLPQDGSFDAPLYPLILASIERFLGTSLLWISLVQGIAGALAAGIVTATTGRLFSRSAAWVAAVASACYAPWIWTDFLVHKTSFALLCAAGWGWCVVGQPTLWRAFGAGLLLGLWVIFREHAILVALAVVPWLGIRHKPHWVVFAGGLVLMLAPWIAHHRHIGESGFWPTTNLGVNFYIGNGEHATGGYKPLIPRRGAARLEQEDAMKIASANVGQTLSAESTSRYWLKRGLREARGNPTRAAWNIARKARLATSPTEPMDADSFEAWADRSLLLRLLFVPFSFSTLLLFGVLGALLSGDSHRSTTPLLTAIALLVLGLLIFFVAGRFRMSAVPLAIPFAAHGVVALSRRFSEGGGRSRLILIGLLPLPVLLLPRPELGDSRSRNWSHIASEALQQGATARALSSAQLALAFDASNADASYLAGIAYRDLGQIEPALTALENAVTDEPFYASEGLFEIGCIQATRGTTGAAVAALTRSLELEPDNLPARLELGRVLRGQRLFAQARVELRQALQIDDEAAEAHFELGVLETLVRGRGAARRAFSRTVQLDPDHNRARIALALALSTDPDALAIDGTAALETLAPLLTRQTQPSFALIEAHAAALAATGDFAGATRVIEQALRLFRVSAPAWMTEQAQLYAASQRLVR